MIDRSEIGSRLRTLRKSRGLSSLEVSQKLGISRSAVQMYEAGKRLPKDDIKAGFAKIYGLSVEDLFFSSVMTRSRVNHVS